MSVSLNTEPVMLVEAVKAVLLLAAVFVTLPVGLEAALVAVVLSVGSLFQRSRVTPV